MIGSRCGAGGYQTKQRDEHDCLSYPHVHLIDGRAIPSVNGITDTTAVDCIPAGGGGDLAL